MTEQERIEDDFWEDDEDFDLYTSCPNCGEDYDEIDYEYQICSLCKYNANNQQLKEKK